ncbi:MAG: hypothetical protein RR582_04940 [Niameybacter sp.]
MGNTNLVIDSSIEAKVKSNLYDLMCKDVVLASFEMRDNSICDISLIAGRNHLLPKQLINFNIYSLTNWLRSRRLDTTRSNARLILKLMKIGTASDIAAVIFNKALSLTDCYWVRKYNSNETYESASLYLRDTVDSIAVTSLSGVLHDLPKITNPEITNIGSFNKAWKKVDGSWWLFKAGSDSNNYAEMFTYYLGKSLDMRMAEYRVINGYVCTKNFTNESIMLEHYASLMYMFNERDYDDEITLANLKCLDIGEAYCDILLLDAIVCNPDRHEFNVGVLRDTNTGSIVSMAPNFDNNLALGSATQNNKPSDFLLKCYLREIGIQQHQKKYLERLTIDLIKEIDLRVKGELNMTLDTNEILAYLTDIIMALNNKEV